MSLTERHSVMSLTEQHSVHVCKDGNTATYFKRNSVQYVQTVMAFQDLHSLLHLQLLFYSLGFCFYVLYSSMLM